MPRKTSSRAKTPRRDSASRSFDDTPRLISAEEKRELILAHAAARAPQDPLQRLSLWAGVTIAVVMILGGWYMTVGWQVKRSWTQGGDDVRTMTERLDAFSEAVETNPFFQQPVAEEGSPSQNAAAVELGVRMKEALEDGTATSVRPLDLLAPAVLGAETEATTTEP